MTADSSSYMLVTLYYMLISKNQLWFNLIYFSMAIFAFIAMIFFVPESPLWLLKSGRTKEACNIIHGIFGYNKVPIQKSEINAIFGVKPSLLDQENSEEEDELVKEKPRLSALSAPKATTEL